MAEEAASEVPMEVVDANQAEDSENGCAKRAREEDDDNTEQNEEKRTKLQDEKSVEEKRVESSADGEEKAEELKDAAKELKEVEEELKEAAEEEEKSGPVTVGPKTFGSSVEMFDYFYKLLHGWTPNLNLNKYEHIVLLELIKKGHLEAERKIGAGVKNFQIRFHPQFKSRCFFLIREDESVDDFSFRKCVDHILPLPENMQIKHDVNKALRGKGGGGRGQRGRGRGRGGR